MRMWQCGAAPVLYRATGCRGSGAMRSQGSRATVFPRTIHVAFGSDPRWASRRAKAPRSAVALASATCCGQNLLKGEAPSPKMSPKFAEGEPVVLMSPLMSSKDLTLVRFPILRVQKETPF